mgnify:CR=1 FL=1
MTRGRRDPILTRVLRRLSGQVSLREAARILGISRSRLSVLLTRQGVVWQPHRAVTPGGILGRTLTRMDAETIRYSATQHRYPEASLTPDWYAEMRDIYGLDPATVDAILTGEMWGTRDRPKPKPVERTAGEQRRQRNVHAAKMRRWRRRQRERIAMDLEQKLYDALRKRGVPKDLHPGFVNYVVRGVHPGAFHTACLEDRFVEAVVRSSEESRAALPAIARFILHDLPATCWGSHINVENWLRNHARTGLPLKSTLVVDPTIPPPDGPEIVAVTISGLSPGGEPQMETVQITPGGEATTEKTWSTDPMPLPVAITTIEPGTTTIAQLNVGTTPAEPDPSPAPSPMDLSTEFGIRHAWTPPGWPPRKS